MALNLYRRHRRECKAGHPEQSFSSEFEERKKGWKRWSIVCRQKRVDGKNGLISPAPHALRSMTSATGLQAIPSSEVGF